MSIIGLAITGYLAFGILYYLFVVFPVILLYDVDEYYQKKRKRILRKKHSEIRLERFNKDFANLIAITETLQSVHSNTFILAYTTVMITLFWPILFVGTFFMGIARYRERKQKIRRKKEE